MLQIRRALWQRGRSGEVRLGCVLWLILVAIFVLILAKMGPVKVNSTKLYETLKDQSRFARQSSGETIRKRILERAKELDLPLTAKGLKVDKGEARIRIICTYTVPIEFPGYTYMWTFRHEVDEPIFYF